MMLMKKQLKYFFAFYLTLLIFGVACDSLNDDCDPFPNKNITELE